MFDEAAGLESKSIIEREEERKRLRIVDPLVGRWVRQNGGVRVQIHVFPHKQAYAVTDGPSLAFMRASSPILAEAEAEADHIAARSAGSEVMIYDDRPEDDNRGQVRVSYDLTAISSVELVPGVEVA